MKQVIAILSLIVMATGTTLSAASNTFLDYQNYNHGYCPTCNCEPCTCGSPQPPPPPCPEPGGPCDPCAPVCGTECGVSICAIGVGVAAVAAAAAIIVTSSSGNRSSHHH